MAEKIPVYILAGGLSTRMGTPKAALPFGNTTLLQFLINNISPIASEVVVVSDKLYPINNVTFIEDFYKNIGPAAGIHAALKHLKTSHACILSCDTPFISYKHIYAILQHHLNITITTYHQKKHPLMGIYNKTELHNWEQLILQGEKKLLFMLSQLQVCYVDVTNDPAFTKQTLLNINTQQQYITALQWL
ncbi:MAG: molybdenum cofactor guanylyltransferase [Bacteroidia bacterium]|nr:molybdenum cofactor guanylyltransferase [Bacteroidia bacterium]